MTARPAWRKLALLLHLTASIGWLGAVVVFLALATVGLTSADDATIRGVYLVMNEVARLALVPLAVASLGSGVVSSLLTPWGLIRHYWVVFKLFMTSFATIVLFEYMETFRQMAERAANRTLDAEALRNPSPAVHAALAIALLVLATVLGIYKPKGVTPYGSRPPSTPWRRSPSTPQPPRGAELRAPPTEPRVRMELSTNLRPPAAPLHR